MSDSLTNPNVPVTKKDLSDFYKEIYPYLGSSGETYASDVGYDNTSSGLTSDDVQDAIDEVNTNLSSKQNVTDNNLATTAKTIVGSINEVNSGLSNKQNSTDNTLTTTSKTVVGAINEVNIGLSNKQNSTDNNLVTTSKNVVGAINELNTNFSNALTNLKNTSVAEWSRAKNESTFTNFINKLALYQNTNWHDTIGNLTSGGNWGFKLVQNYGCTVENGGFTTGNDATNGIVVENTYGARCLIYFTVIKATSTGSVAQCGAGTSSLTLPTAYTTGANRTQYRDGLSFIVSVPAGYRAYINGANIRIIGASWFPIEQDQTSTYSVTSNGTKDMGSTNSYRYINVNVPNSNSSTYTMTKVGTADMGSTNSYRYVSTNPNLYLCSLTARVFEPTSSAYNKQLSFFKSHIYLNGSNALISSIGYSSSYLRDTTATYTVDTNIQFRFTFTYSVSNSLGTLYITKVEVYNNSGNSINAFASMMCGADYIDSGMKISSNATWTTLNDGSKAWARSQDGSYSSASAAYAAIGTGSLIFGYVNAY